MTTILLVEDDTVLREGLTELFAREGYQVITAGSLREARANLTNEVQAIVMDAGLPDGDGVNLCREWRPRARSLTWSGAWIPAGTTM